MALQGSSPNLQGNSTTIQGSSPSLQGNSTVVQGSSPNLQTGSNRTYNFMNESVTVGPSGQVISTTPIYSGSSNSAGSFTGSYNGTIIQGNTTPIQGSSGSLSMLPSMNPNIITIATPTNTIVAPTTSNVLPTAQTSTNQTQNTTQNNANTTTNQILPANTGSISTPAVNFNNLQQGFDKASSSSLPVPQTAGGANSAISGFMGNGQSTPSNNATTFLNNDSTIQGAISTVTQFLSPTITQSTLQSYVNQIQTDQNVLAGLNVQMMNLKNIMNGTSEDIRNEITAANGFATESQVTAMATARNNTLLKQANLLQNQIDTATRAVSNDQNLLTEERQIATDTFNQNATIYNSAQTLQTQHLKSATDGLNTLISAVGISGLVNGLLNADPTGATLSNAAKLMGTTPGALWQAAKTDYSNKQLEIKQKQASINASNASAAHSVAETNNLNANTDFAKTHGGLTPAEFSKQQSEQGQNLLNDAAKYVAAFAGNGKIDGMPVTWGGAWNFLHTKYPDASNETIDNLLRADLYRNKQFGG